MKLSIITINYNNAKGLRMTMESVLKQTYRDIEYVVVDGASTDGSVDVIREMSASLNDGLSRDKSLNDGMSLIWSSEPDKGIYDAMNKGIKRAKGEYVYVLNSGDELAAADVVERMMNILNDGMPILLGNIVHVYGDGKKVRERIRKKTNDLILQPIEASMLTFYTGTIPHDSAFVRRDLFEKYGYFDEDMKKCADWKLTSI